MTTFAPAVLAAPPTGPQMLVLGFAAVLAVAAIGVSLFAVWRAQVLATLATERAREGVEGCEATIGALQKILDGLASELQDLKLHGASAPLPAVPKAGLNLCKRSQALRMHRKGDPPAQIAAALEVPLQEVDLLIKVHRIVISNL